MNIDPGHNIETGTTRDPWYNTPVSSVLGWIGNVTYETPDYAIRSVDGTLVFSRKPKQQAPAASQTSIMDTVRRIPSVVWYGAAALVVLQIVRR